MQTFLPYDSFHMSARCLDYRRLGKQRVECKQILQALYHDTGWRHHPAVKMWRDYEMALEAYYNTMVEEWVRRGYNNNMPIINIDAYAVEYPPWLGNPYFHNSHKSNLLRKDPEYYSQFSWTVPPDLPYVWPKIHNP